MKPACVLHWKTAAVLAALKLPVPVYEERNCIMGKKKKKRSYFKSLDKKNKVIFCVSVILIVACILALGVVGVSQWRLKADPTAGDSEELPEVATPADIKKKQTNILVCGIDSDDNRSTHLTDVIMVVNLDMEKKKMSILQIPRDTYIGNDYPTGKINAVYGNKAKGGINGLKNVIYSSFKINIDYYVTMTMKGFRNIVDAIDGVEIELAEPFYFAEDGRKTISLKAGKNTLGGYEAEAFVRERQSRGSDLERVKAQRQFLAAFAQEIMGMSKTDLVKKIVPKVFNELTTDFNLSEALGYVDVMKDFSLENMTVAMLPGEGAEVNGYSVYGVHAQKLVEMLNENFRPYQDPLTVDDLGIKQINNKNQYYDDTQTDFGSLLNQDSSSSASKKS